jgi:hypothetical protein
VADLLADYITLFRGRADCYGSWEGGCVRAPLTPEVFWRHLNDGPHIGVYPAVHYNNRSHVVWGCTDIDYDDYDEAKRLQDAFAAVDVTAWTEKTRKGWHVWVFAQELVPAEDMRNMFLACHQVANSQPKEVNPKQTNLAPNQVGNYVRLPYPMGDNAYDRVVMQDGNRVRLQHFVDSAIDLRCTAAQVADLATYYIPPPQPAVEIAAPSQDITEAMRRLNPLGRLIFRHGPPTGRGDRSTSLASLAHTCHDSGLAASDALSLLEDADLRWGKFMMRGEAGRNELVKIVQRVYGHTPAT